MQAGTLHATDSVSAGHDVPPFAAAVVTVRERDCVADPHVAVHELHSLHADTAQLTGHVPATHDVVSVSAGHAVPPFAAAVVTVRDRD